MKTKNFVGILIICALIIIGSIALSVVSTKTEPYKEYSPYFQQRGDKLTDERFPKNASDSLFAVQMEVRQYQDETRNELNENKINWTGVISGGSGILIAFLGILGSLFTYMDKRRSNEIVALTLHVDTQHYETRQVIDDNHSEAIKRLDINEEEHRGIHKILEVVEDITVRRAIEESFRGISRNFMYYQKGNIPETLQTLITAQAERLIELSDQIMTEHFTMPDYEFALIKIEEQCKIGCRQVVHIFGEKFLSYYKCAQGKATKEFKYKLLLMANDEKFNGKYGRYKRAGEGYLDTLISLTIEEYKRYTQDGNKTAF